MSVCSPTATENKYKRKTKAQPLAKTPASQHLLLKQGDVLECLDRKK